MTAPEGEVNLVMLSSFQAAYVISTAPWRALKGATKRGTA